MNRDLYFAILYFLITFSSINIAVAASMGSTDLDEEGQTYMEDIGTGMRGGVGAGVGASKAAICRNFLY